MARAILMLCCPDRRGLVARLSGFLYDHGGNIVEAGNHTDFRAGLFLTRLEWELEGFDIPRAEIATAFEPLGTELGADWRIAFSDSRPKVALWVSKQSHCLHDLLWRQKAGELRADIPIVISNHAKLGPVARSYGANFYHLPVTGETKATQEAKELELLRVYEIDLVVLAKYMQVLTDDFLTAFPRVINIHHSFLPAFAGARPYHRAHERGVKIIGATAHYATADLDEGPIIEQDVVRVSHVDSTRDLIRKGRDVERMVLARAVRLHLEDRVLVYGNRTVVF